MKFIDPHIHMVSRTTADYEALAAEGVVAVIEPAFWLGQPRTNTGAFQHYFATLVGWERFRASQFGIQHYCMMGLNSKEANNEALAEEVLQDLLPRYLFKDGVVAVGEIGFDDVTPLEEKAYRAQLEMAKQADDMTVCVHTPHRDKKRGTSLSMDIALEHGIDPATVVIDHNNEETVQEVLDRGFYAAFTIYPGTKMGNERLVPIIQRYGSERIIVDSSADWGVSDALSVPKTARVLQKHGIPEADIERVCYGNALAVYGRNGVMTEDAWLDPAAVDQRALYEGNSVLRGQPPKVGAGAAESDVIE